MYTCFLGAEGCSEAEGLDWVRPATEEEVDALLNSRLGKEEGSREKKALHDALSLDRTGRPYWPMTFLEEAPEEAKTRAQTFSRMVHLFP